jgi:hypothetical protein
MSPDQLTSIVTELEFCLGGTCPTKILHARAGLPRAEDSDSFAAWMGQEAGKVRALARELFPNAVDVGTTDLAAGWQKTTELLAASGSVARAVLVTENAACRADVIEGSGSILRLYTFVPKAVDLEKYRFGLEFTSSSGRLRREWREHFELIAFRVWIARQLFPSHRIVPLVVVPVVGVPCSVEGLHGYFENRDGRWVLTSTHAAAEANRLLRVMSVAKECEPLVATVAARVETLRGFLAKPLAPAIGYHCKKCEFQVPGVKNGYDQCWGPLARVTPHMFDLAYMYFIHDPDGHPVADRLAREGRVSMHDIPEDLIAGEYAERQHMQIEGTSIGREIIRPELYDALANATYPMHFLDIEALRSLVPAHQGLKVNDLALFQFSVHSRASDGASLTHVEWLNTEPADPNRRFLAALRAAVGDTGSVCIWTRFEENSFAELLTELIAAGVEDEDFDWLRRFLVSGRLLDLHELCFKYYFHPRMKGRTSIKIVLPAVWSEPSPIKEIAPYNQFAIDPYTLLKSADAVGDGCAAMEAYLAMQAPEHHEEMGGQLLRYCGIDTIAMVFIWDYWKWRMAGSAGG